MHLQAFTAKPAAKLFTAATNGPFITTLAANNDIAFKLVLFKHAAKLINNILHFNVYIGVYYPLFAAKYALPSNTNVFNSKQYYK